MSLASSVRVSCSPQLVTAETILLLGLSALACIPIGSFILLMRSKQTPVVSSILRLLDFAGGPMQHVRRAPAPIAEDTAEQARQARIRNRMSLGGLKEVAPAEQAEEETHIFHHQQKHAAGGVLSLILIWAFLAVAAYQAYGLFLNVTEYKACTAGGGHEHQSYRVVSRVARLPSEARLPREHATDLRMSRPNQRRCAARHNNECAAVSVVAESHAVVTATPYCRSYDTQHVLRCQWQPDKPPDSLACNAAALREQPPLPECFHGQHRIGQRSRLCTVQDSR
eukprot:TRINITY_DN9565_c0_g1_i1.p1 TRINITY_DN9565_c0_g1~~TRINITY_DN9565_c0_g1_i1.p1  ORF type:complete len:282 (-),score=35.01 TRINITY_DN9565_c0_g1_i1:148-993(-)